MNLRTSSESAKMAEANRSANGGKRKSIFVEKYEHIIHQGILEASERGYNVAYIEINKTDYDCMGGQEEVDFREEMESFGYKVWFKNSTDMIVVLEIAFWS